MATRQISVITSNDEPFFHLPQVVKEGATKNKDFAANCYAYNRRFNTLHFTKMVDIPSITVCWDHLSAERAAIGLYMMCIDKMPERIKTMFSRYTDFITERLEEDGRWQEEFLSITDQEITWLEKNLPFP